MSEDIKSPKSEENNADLTLEINTSGIIYVGGKVVNGCSTFYWRRARQYYLDQRVLYNP